MGSDINTRLNEALRIRGWSARELHLALEEQGRLATGTAYTTVRDYISGAYDPNVSWLVAAAELLRVDKLWLLTGEEMPTETHAQEGFAAAAGGYHRTWSDTPRRLHEYEGGLTEGLGRWLSWMSSSSVGLVHACRRWWFRLAVSDMPDSEEDVRRFDRAVAHRVGAAAAAPLRELGVDIRALSEDQLNLYLLGMVPVLTLLAEMYPSRGEDES